MQQLTAECQGCGPGTARKPMAHLALKRCAGLLDRRGQPHQGGNCCIVYLGCWASMRSQRAVFRLHRCCALGERLCWHWRTNAHSLALFTCYLRCDAAQIAMAANSGRMLFDHVLPANSWASNFALSNAFRRGCRHGREQKTTPARMEQQLTTVLSGQVWQRTEFCDGHEAENQDCLSREQRLTWRV